MTIVLNFFQKKTEKNNRGNYAKNANFHAFEYFVTYLNFGDLMFQIFSPCCPKNDKKITRILVLRINQDRMKKSKKNSNPETQKNAFVFPTLHCAPPPCFLFGGRAWRLLWGDLFERGIFQAFWRLQRRKCLGRVSSQVLLAMSPTPPQRSDLVPSSPGSPLPPP